MIASVLLLLVVLMQGAPASPGTETRSSPAPSYVPQRVFDAGKQGFSDFETMLADLARADVVLVGEQHDDPNTHRLEAAILEGLSRRRVPVILSMEMFERDTQPLIERYVSGAIGEDEFLKGARPWPRYSTDYRALVEMARANGWKAVAANMPRKYASDIAKTGLSALEALSGADRALVGADLQCPLDEYFTRFAEMMRAHPGSGAAEMSEEQQRATTARYYEAQCAKDETMAESIAAAIGQQGSARGTLVHFTGAFHVDFAAGTADRVRRRLTGRRVTVVTMLPVDDLDALAPSREDAKRAEYLVYTIKSR